MHISSTYLKWHIGSKYLMVNFEGRITFWKKKETNKVELMIIHKCEWNNHENVVTWRYSTATFDVEIIFLSNKCQWF